MITTDTYVFFYSGREVYSNWHTTPRQFTDPVTKFVFNNTEAAFMWEKANFFGDHETAEKVVLHAEANREAREVKAFGRLVKGYDDAAWECVREGLMTYVNLEKYRQNPEWGAMLKATGDRILVEASPVDGVWGVKLDVEAAAAFAAKEMERIGQDCASDIAWPGRNLLGKALMTVRGLL